MIEVFLKHHEVEQTVGQTTKATTKGWKTTLETWSNLHKEKKKKTEHQLKAKDQHHTTLHSGQP